MLSRGSLTRDFCGAVILLTASILSLSAQVRTRITQTVDGSSTIRLPRTTHPLATAANDLGRADAGLPMQRMLLHLTSGPEQEAALEALAVAQYDPASPSYHQWVTPVQFGQQFGVSQADLDTITGWLQSQGFTVSAVAAGRRSIEFNGTASQVEQAFHTEMHRYSVNGVEHIANSSDISIPSALAPVVGGVLSLHNFRAHPLHTVISHTGGPKGPRTDLSGGSNALSPYDFATIYDVAALWNLNFDGTGQTVAIAGRTNINPADVTAFRTAFGLPGNNTQIVVNGKNPGIISSDEETEADLDVEWSGAVAKGAAIKFVVSASTNSSDGVDLSDQYIVDNNLAPVLSLSFGSCEAENGSSNSFYNNLWQQAAAQGISVFVAAGDSGSAGCDVDYSTNQRGADNTAPASHGFGVSGLASTPYTVAVGGTEFNDTASPSTYWNSANTSANVSSAKSYIPEVAWNESDYTVGGANNSLLAGSGGVSEIYATPSWQTGTGVPLSDPGASTQHHRYLPDVALSAAGHDGYLVYQEGQLELVGGTSASTPSFAGLMAIIDQYSGERNGNPNQRLYPLATQYPALFHDVTGGTNAVPCVGGSPDCSSTSAATTGVMTGYNATPGYDLATGLGSVDAYALALKWSNGPAPLSITSLTPNPMTASASSQTLTINGTGFQTGATVKVSYTGFSGTLAITSLTATQILATINTGTAAQVWTVQVANSSSVASNTASLTVSAPSTAPTAPAIASLSPNSMTGSNSSQILTITGSGFATGDTVKATYAGGTVSTLQILSLSATQIQASIVTGTTARTWTLQVVNASGAASNSASLTVTAPTGPTAPTAPAKPAITSVSSLKAENASQTLTVTGTGFTPGNGLQVVIGYNGYGYYYPVTSATATQIQVQFNPDGVTRTWEIEVIDSNNAISNVATFQSH
jgi:pseudomonalisin